jgi:quercetin dioxygenase-like cupin family protein
VAERVTSDRGSGADGSEPVSTLVPAADDSELALDVVRLAGGRRLALFELPTDRDLLLYAFAGTGTLTIQDETHDLAAQAAALALAGEDVSLEAGPEGLAAICASVGPSVDRHAPMGPRGPVVRLQDTDSDRATGARSFEILLGPHNGSTRATLFVGHLPPGRAPWHYHLYDEIVWIPEGPGRLHVGEAVEELGPGSAFRLRPRETHVVENASQEQVMSLVGVFTPAGSPSAAYLTADVAAEYRFAD